MYKRMVDLSLGTKKTEVREDRITENRPAKKSEYTYLCRKGAAAHLSVQVNSTGTACLIIRKPALGLLRSTLGHAEEIFLARPSITLPIAAFPRIYFG